MVYLTELCKLKINIIFYDLYNIIIWSYDGCVYNNTI